MTITIPPLKVALENNYKKYMLEALPFITPLHLALVPIVIGLTQAVKGFVETSRWSRFIPLIAVGISIALCALIGGGPLAVIVGGLFVGLSACGLYSTSSTLKNG